MEIQGKVYGCAIKANETLALHAKKIGHILYPGRNLLWKDYCCRYRNIQKI